MVGRRGVPGRTTSLFVDLDVPVGGSGERGDDVVDANVGVGVECSAVLVRVDGMPHRLEVVADDEQRATGSYCGEHVVDAAIVGSAGNRCVVCGHEVELAGMEGSTVVRIGPDTDDRQTPLAGNRRDPVDRTLRDVGGSDLPTVVREPHCVAAFSGTDVERRLVHRLLGASSSHGRLPPPAAAIRLPG